jgi:5,10-methylene-tetrahydrofolate dehydrogenase/methenyl tetrahydrofolate cyclohydrolase
LRSIRTRTSTASSDERRPLATGLPALVPCTPLGCVMLAKSVHDSLSGLEAVVVGRSNIVGKPLAQLLIAENATVTVAHSKTRDCRRCAAAPISCSRRSGGPRWCAATGSSRARP